MSTFEKVTKSVVTLANGEKIAKFAVEYKNGNGKKAILRLVAYNGGMFVQTTENYAQQVVIHEGKNIYLKRPTAKTFSFMGSPIDPTSKSQEIFVIESVREILKAAVMKVKKTPAERERKEKPVQVEVKIDMEALFA